MAFFTPSLQIAVGGGVKHYPIDLIFGMCHQDMLWMNWFNEQRDPRKMMKNETP